MQELSQTLEGMNVHHFGDITLPGMEQKERNENRGGKIVIGGDLGDVWASSAWRGETDAEGHPSVELVNAEFRTYEDMTVSEARAHLEQTVQFSYASIGSDAFISD